MFNYNNKKMKTIKDSDLYDKFHAKFNIQIQIDEDGRKKVSGLPNAWHKIKTDVSSRNSDNISILTGSINKITVIDLDKLTDEKGICGVEWFKQNICKLDNLNTLVTTTIRGGNHIFFNYNKEVKTSANVCKFNRKIKIDIRNDGGMIYEGKGYTLLHNAKELADIPESFLKFLKKEPERKKIEAKQYQLPMNHKYIKTILDGLSSDYPENFDSWRNAGMILKNLELDAKYFHYFSARSDKYNETEVQSFYDALPVVSPSNTDQYIGMGSLLFYYKESKGEARYKQVIRDINKTKKNVIDASNTSVIISGDTEFLKSKSLYLHSKIFNDDGEFDKEAREEFI
jgi:hypothetical protein